MPGSTTKTSPTKHVHADSFFPTVPFLTTSPAAVPPVASVTRASSPKIQSASTQLFHRPPVAPHSFCSTSIRLKFVPIPTATSVPVESRCFPLSEAPLAFEPPFITFPDQMAYNGTAVLCRPPSLTVPSPDASHSAKVRCRASVPALLVVDLECWNWPLGRK